MILGSLVDAGLPLEQLIGGLSALGLHEYRLVARKEQRGPISGTRVLVQLSPDASTHRRSLADIQHIVEPAPLPPTVKAASLGAFERLATVEARIHGVPVEQVHFHEVGAVDAIVDVVGAFLGLQLLGIDQVFCSAIPCGPGTLDSSHGMLPLPAPATLAVLAEAHAPVKPAPVTTTPLGELVTPTAAAILSEAASFRQPEMNLESVGYGVGTRDHPELPNVLRLWLGQTEDAHGDASGEVQLLETNIDDMNPEFYGYVAELLFRERALDVWCTPIQMKKGRPATMISVLARPPDASRLAGVLLEHTSTLGVRMHSLKRWEAERETLTVDTALGPAAVKLKVSSGTVRHVAPEYDSCTALARKHNLPLAEIYRQVEAAAWRALEERE